jgi:signal peptidase I
MINAQSRPARLRRRERIALLILLALAVGIFLNFQRVIVSGHSMDPTYHNGQTVLVWKTMPRSELKPGEVIVFRQGQDELIKRIVYITPRADADLFPPPGFPEIIKTPRGTLGIAPYNSFFLSFNWYFVKVRLGFKPKPPPADRIYVMGDNFPISDDSRDFGPINENQIMGRVIP